MVSACPGQFPKTNGCDRLYAEDVNLLYGNFIGMRSTEAETAMNIAKLQYCQSVTDINHDYMVVDVFTDSTGYNNTVMLGSYTPNIFSTNNCCCFWYVDGWTACLTYGNFYISLYKNSSCCTDDQCYCISQTFNCFGEPINNVCKFGFCVNCYIGNYNTCCTNCTILQIVNSHDDFCCCIALTAGQSCGFEVTNCYCYNCIGTNCWCFYKNGVGVCEVSFINYPTPTYSLYGTRCSHGFAYIRACMLNPVVYLKCGTTSAFCSSNLTGNYQNLGSSPPFTLCELGYYNDFPTNFTKICGDTCYYVAVLDVSADCDWRNCSACYSFCPIFPDFNPLYSKYFCFCISGTVWANSWNNCVNKGYSCISYSGGCDDFTCCVASESATINIVRCYCFVCACDCCYDFYCNGVCKCQITLSTAPCLSASGCIWKGSSLCYLHDLVSCFSFVGFCQNTLTCLKISTVPICWSAPIKTIYYTDEKYGTGTVVYNVIDSATGNCIACNLLPKTLYNLDCCIQCHRYEIIQCSDGVSCIKSYAIVTGVY